MPAVLSKHVEPLLECARAAEKAQWQQFCWSCKNLCGKKLQYCQSCKTATYCSRFCQRVDWKAHKRVCQSYDKNVDRGQAWVQDDLSRLTVERLDDVLVLRPKVASSQLSVAQLLEMEDGGLLDSDAVNSLIPEFQGAKPTASGAMTTSYSLDQCFTLGPGGRGGPGARLRNDVTDDMFHSIRAKFNSSGCEIESEDVHSHSSLSDKMSRFKSRADARRQGQNLPNKFIRDLVFNIENNPEEVSK